MKTLTTTIALLITFVFTTIAQPSNHIEVVTTQESGSTYISWTTQTEVNTSFFIVERTIDGQTYTLVKRVKAQGSTQLPTTYEIEDTDTNTVAHYKITLVTMSGDQIVATSGVGYESSIAKSEVR